MSKKSSQAAQEEFPRVFRVYQSVQGQSDEAKDKALEAFRREVGEEDFHRQMLLFADRIQEDQFKLQRQIQEIKKTPDWLFEPWIKLSEVCLRLYGKNDKSSIKTFNQKRLGLKPWHPEELERLEDIRQELAQRLVTSAQ